MLKTINDVKVNIYRKNIKNMHLYVKPPDGHVEVSCPTFVSDSNVTLFINTNLSWIKKQIDKFENQIRIAEREYVTGETFTLWGTDYYLKVIDTNDKPYIKVEGDTAKLFINKNTKFKNIESFVKKWYREKLNERLNIIVPKWENITGLQVSDYKTKIMKTRFGTCNIKTKVIWINLEMVKKPYEALDYVVLHEILHLKEKYHNKHFKSLMDRYMPNWVDIRRNLNQMPLTMI